MTILNPFLNYVIWYMQPLLGLLIGVLVLSFVGYINWVGTIKRDTTSWFAKHLFDGGFESDASADGLFMAVSGFAVMFGGILIVLAILYLNH
jgi:hypothetical protein